MAGFRGAPGGAPGRPVSTSPLGDWLKDDPDVDVAASRPERRAVILRRIDLWSALKVSLALYLSIFAVVFAGALLAWLAARQAGLLDEIEHWVELLGFADEGSFRLQGPEIATLSAVIGPILVVLGSLATVAGVALFNGIARLFGGVEITVSDGDDLGPRSKRY